MTTNSQYADYVVRAEAAVAGVRDPELRKAAFQKILDDLLSNRPKRLLTPKTPDVKHRHTHPHIPGKIKLVKKTSH